MSRKNTARTLEARETKVRRIVSGGRVVRYNGTLPEARRYVAYLDGRIDPSRVFNPCGK